MFIIGILLEDIMESDECDDDSDSESIEVINLIKNSIKRVRVPRIRCKNYVENVVWQYTDVEFKTHFRYVICTVN